MKKILSTSLAVSALLVTQTGVALAKKDGPAQMDRLGAALEYVAKQTEKARNTRANVKAQLMGKAGPNNELTVANVTPDGYVVINAVASGDTDDLAETMESMGAQNVSSYGRMVSASFPADRLADLSGSGYLAFARPNYATTNVGLVTSQGDRSMRTDEVRANYGVDGTGMMIGVISDSFDCVATPITTMADDIANGDLPSNIVILDDIASGCSDEGRGMAQLIHDVLPGAGIMFHTAFNGEADFAGGIVELAMAGADVIVDDVIYFTEPMFQDGIIAQAADEAARLGVPYYSSNGNRARDALQTEYRAVNATIDGISGIWHDFDEGAGVDPLMTVNFNGALQTNLSFQWDSPNFSVSGAPGAQNDVDVVMFDSTGAAVPDCFEPGGQSGNFCQFTFTDGGVPIDGGMGGDAVEFLSLVDFTGGALSVQIGFLTDSGAAPGFVKFVVAGGGFAASEYPINSPSGYGHNNAAGAEGVGAAAFYFTEEFIGDPNTDTLRAGAGEPPCIPACLNSFSSAGGTPIFFDTAGHRLYEPQVRLKPGLTGPDGTNTSFFGNDTSRDDDDNDGVFMTGEPGEFPNFFGTSAAAPHAAAVAALMIDTEGSQIRTTRGNSKKEFWNICRQFKQRPGREHGISLIVSKKNAQRQVARGKALLRSCEATPPQGIYNIMRHTAQDMTVQASNGTGATVRVFEENVVPGADGFDFDSGFGFVDGVAAVSAISGHGHHASEE